MSEKINIVVGFDQKDLLLIIHSRKALLKNLPLPVSFIPLAINTLKSYAETHKDKSNDFVYSRFLKPYLHNFKD